MMLHQRELRNFNDGPWAYFKPPRIYEEVGGVIKTRVQGEISLC